MRQGLYKVMIKVLIKVVLKEVIKVVLMVVLKVVQKVVSYLVLKVPPALHARNRLSIRGFPFHFILVSAQGKGFTYRYATYIKKNHASLHLLQGVCPGLRVERPDLH